MALTLPNMQPALRALSNRNFAIYAAGNSFSLVGMWVQRLAVGWLMWELTESSLWIGIIALAEFVPILIVTPFGGVLADRFDRRSLAILGQTLSCVQAALLCALTFAGLVTPLVIVALMLMGGIVFAINQSARLALIPNMVPKEHLGSALAITAVNFNLARFVGPAVAGLLITQFGIAWAFAFNTFSYLTIVAALLIINVTTFKRERAVDSNLFTDFMEGLRFAGGNRAVASLLLLIAAGAVFARPVTELLPGFAAAVFDRGADGLAIFTSAMGLGAIVAGLWLANRPSVEGLTRITVIAILANAIAVFVFAVSGNFWIAVVALTVAGFAQLASGTGSQTLIQTVVEEEVRGRVLSLWALTMRGGPSFGALTLGWLFDQLGYMGPLAVSSLIAGTLTLIVMGQNRDLARRFELKAVRTITPKSGNAAAAVFKAGNTQNET